MRVGAEYSEFCPHVERWDKVLDLFNKVSGIYLPWFENVPLIENHDDSEKQSYRIAVVSGSDKQPTEEVANEIKNLISFQPYGKENKTN